MLEVVVTITDLLEDLLLGVGLKRKISADKCVQDDTERPKIWLFAVVALDHFWCHIVRCPRYLRQAFSSMWRSSQSKIDQSNSVLLSNHDIVWFNISVDHIQRVTMIDCLEKLLHISGGALFCECLIFLLNDLLIHGHAFDIFHD